MNTGPRKKWKRGSKRRWLAYICGVVWDTEPPSEERRKCSRQGKRGRRVVVVQNISEKGKVRAPTRTFPRPARDYLEASKISVAEPFWARSSFSSFVSRNE